MRSILVKTAILLCLGVDLIPSTKSSLTGLEYDQGANTPGKKLLWNTLKAKKKPLNTL